MRTIRAMMGLALMAVCGFANAAPKAHHDNATKEEVVDTYLDAVVHGDLNGIDKAIDDNARFYVQRGVRILATDKHEVMNYLKTNANIDKNCVYDNTVLDQGENFVVEKVEMKFKELTRTDVITAQRSDDGWKITKVETSYK